VRQLPALLALLVFAAAGAAQAQQLYRWTDDKGKVHITDSPPPGNAKDVQKAKPAATATPSAAPAEQLPFEVAIAAREFPVTLYTFTNCEEPCQKAREALNKRGVPFKEVQIKDEAGQKELKEVSGSIEAPTLLVGRSVQTGFTQSGYDALLDAARYPKAGAVPARNQGKPGAEETAKAEAKKAAEEPKPGGRYSPKPPGKEQPEPPKRYAPIPGKDEPKTGPYNPK
jgi:glutaredoxin